MEKQETQLSTAKLAVENENENGGIERENKELKCKEKEEMKPWEQHSSVISIPRFDYNAPSALLRQSHSGFLITCPIKREKSATKEAMSIFEKHTVLLSGVDNGSLEINNPVKRRKKCQVIKGDTKSFDCKDVADESEKLCSAQADSDTIPEVASGLSLVKLTRSGLLLFTFPSNKDPAVVDIVSNIFQSLETGTLKPPHFSFIPQIAWKWCHRIFPIQATCILEEKEVHAVVGRLADQFFNDKQDKVASPVKFAVGFNRRGMEETNMKDRNIILNGSDSCTLLDRNKCFTVVATAVKEVVADSVVDLKCPEFAVLLEVLPLSGISGKKIVVAVSILPQKLVSTKPRLCIKALISDTKPRNDLKDS